MFVLNKIACKPRAIGTGFSAIVKNQSKNEGPILASP